MDNGLHIIGKNLLIIFMLYFLALIKKSCSIEICLSKYNKSFFYKHMNVPRILVVYNVFNIVFCNIKTELLKILNEGKSWTRDYVFCFLLYIYSVGQ